MRNLFFPVVDQVCRNQWCSLHGQSVGLQTTLECAECHGRLSRVHRFEAVRALRAVAALAAAGGGILLLWKLDMMAGPLQTALSSTPPPDQQPTVLDSATRTELTDLFRGAYRDGEVTTEERGAINRAIATRRLRVEDVKTLEQNLRPRVIAATRSLSTAKRHIDARHLEEAVREYRRATEIDPEDPLAWAGLAAAHTLEGETEASERAYQQALALDPDNWLVNYNLGLAAERLGESEVALECFRRALGSLRADGPERRAVIEELKNAPELRALRGNPHFADLLQTQSP